MCTNIKYIRLFEYIFLYDRNEDWLMKERLCQLDFSANSNVTACLSVPSHSFDYHTAEKQFIATCEVPARIKTERTRLHIMQQVLRE
jgi:hypothetical protein